MRLHDAFGLALSVALSQNGHCPLSKIECIGACVDRACDDEDVQADQAPALLMHHLLWRANQCDGLERRAALRRTLLGWVDELADDPEAFFRISRDAAPRTVESDNDRAASSLTGTTESGAVALPSGAHAPPSASRYFSPLTASGPATALGEFGRKSAHEHDRSVGSTE